MANNMKICVKERIMIRPAKETPQRNLWVSDLDLIVSRAHVPTVYFYKQQPNNTSNSNFFEAQVLKDALSEVLVPFYPAAGRLGEDENGRIHINCNGNGALFIEAETTSFLHHFGDFTPCSDMLHLVPDFDSYDDISSYPLFSVQLTRFGCGSVCIGVSVHHIVVDGISAIHFINSWSDIARGIPITNPPFIDRTLLDARVPPTPTYHHIEYDPPPTMMNTSSQTHDSKPISTKMFKITRDQLTTLKSKINSGIKYSTYEILTAHIWHCVCKARELCNDQAVKLFIPTDGRFRFDPPLPAGYFGNVQFTTTVLSSANEIESSQLDQIVEKIHKSLKKKDDGYLRSALDYLKKQPDLTVVRRGPHTFKCPNMDIVSWTSLPLYDADFGWGKPIYMGRAKVSSEGMACIVRGPNNDNTLSLIIGLHANHMDSFHNLFYEILDVNDGRK
ncbi:shikimate O-hydroxycinnamoyltransferase-like [Euphorbia lathyris]|uniref:shikimate O-hydroxycinnamoyltransferase-like n=1 Tax=Euphorbia lathyris TaxID=212925 RepID=UPI0033142BF0